MGAARKIGVPSAPEVHRQRSRERRNDLAFFLMAGLVAAGMFWLFQQAHDGWRESDFCTAAVRLVLAEQYPDHRILSGRLLDRPITRDEAIRLIFPNYDPDLPRVMRYRPPPTDDMLKVMVAARRFGLRKILLSFQVRNASASADWSPVRQMSCVFLRLDGETQWLRFTDRSAFLTAARISLDHGALPDACCLYHHPEVR
ncbi:MAG: hypothetical protein D6757_08530 [Alphaproteobacteria bacterium]|nr:MAG: hypothetical protein D6757_08530 [Alphaproteobacteria bacterium]